LAICSVLKDKNTTAQLIQRKLLDNKCLNESTLIALKEEQERKQRLNGINQLSLSLTAMSSMPEQSEPEVAISHTLATDCIDQDGNNLTDSCSAASSSISSHSGLLDDDMDSGSSSCGTDDVVDDDLICLDDPSSELKANSQCRLIPITRKIHHNNY
jgi:hypothetical protein